MKRLLRNYHAWDVAGTDFIADSEEYGILRRVVILGARLTVGQRTLNPYVGVQILRPQLQNTPRQLPGRIL